MHTGSLAVSPRMSAPARTAVVLQLDRERDVARVVPVDDAEVELLAANAMFS
jgi:hypothetical protein